MRFRVFVSALLLATLTLLSSTAHSCAQVPFLPSVRVKAGVFLPQNTSLLNAVGNTWLKIGADVSVPVSPVPLGTTRVGIDYVVNSSSNIVPLTLTQIFQPSVGL